MEKPIYLDYNASTPLDPVVAAEMRPFLDLFGNPSSNHWYGVQMKQAVEKARRQVAELIGCEASEVIFTSGGSESNNYAIKGVAFANKNRGNHIITSTLEHPAVFEVCEYLKTQGFEATYIPVDEFGMIDIDALKNAISSRTILITVMHANNEVGTIQPIAEIGQIAREKKIHFHTDASQSLGKIPTSVNDLGVDLLTVTGHKLYAPAGIGALFVRHGVTLEKQVHGAGHELNKRAGTENVLEIVGLGKACEIARTDLEENMQQMKEMRDRLFSGISKKISDVKLNGHPEKRLPNTLNLSFPNVEANLLLDELDGVAASAGAACHSDSIDISATLKAMNLPIEYAMGTIRFSTGKFLGENDIDRAVELITDAVARLRPAEGDAPVSAKTNGEIKLTRYTQGLGCACKLRPQALERVLKDMPLPQDARILVGLNTADDAAVYKIDDETAIVQTVDFFTPIVDDPFQFGAIAATNALSDIYAMGGKPLFALNIVGFPSNRLPMEVLGDILKGAQTKAAEAGISILGGHTIDDTEPKFGLAVTGLVHPDRILTNAGAQPGDALILTKPIGLGIISTAVKRGLADPETSKLAIDVMRTLNRTAAESLSDFTVHACTDVTGFGLLGHLKEMVLASKVLAEVWAAKVPLLPQARDLAVAGIVPGGTTNNLEFVSDLVEWSEAISDIEQLLLCDAQTSGGLLISLPEKQAESLKEKLLKTGVQDSEIIGRIVKASSGNIRVH